MLRYHLNMSLKERILGGSDKNTAEKLTRLSKLVDVATVGGALVLGMIFPVFLPAATAAIELSVATYASGEIAESELKRRKKKH